MKPWPNRADFGPDSEVGEAVERALTLTTGGMEDGRRDFGSMRKDGYCWQWGIDMHRTWIWQHPKRIVFVPSGIHCRLDSIQKPFRDEASILRSRALG